ncbi:MAG: hypothetical protein LBE80_01420 [Deltaproteobacteria bacterium]|jgi:chromosomal replication initiator protein|nr:hypothetical protein [Deltaproteobacteria bacterium]
MTDLTHEGETDASIFSEVWTNACGNLQDTVGTDVFRNWIYPLKPSFDPDKNLLSLESPMLDAKLYVENNFYDLLRAAVRDACLKLGLQIMEVKLTAGDFTPTAPTRPAGWQEAIYREPKLKGFYSQNMEYSQPFNPWNTFNNFVVGESNQMAYECCQAFSKDRQLGNNLLFVLSDTGLGKSHLAQAAGSYVTNQDRVVSYLLAKDYSNHYVDSINKKNFKNFNDGYKTTDLMVIEDVTFFTKKTPFQNEFCTVIDFLLNKGKKIVVTSHQPPSQIPYLSPAFRSRLSAGLVTQISPPSYETRLEILKKVVKANSLRMPITVLELVAQSITDDVRRLTSCLTSLQAKSDFEKRPIDTNLAKDVLAFSSQSPPSQAALTKIKNLICEAYSLQESDLTSTKVTKSLNESRAIAIYLAKTLTDHSLSEIGRAFNRRHSTIHYNVNKIMAAIQSDDKLRNKIDYFIRQLGQKN